MSDLNAENFKHLLEPLGRALRGEAREVDAWILLSSFEGPSEGEKRRPLRPRIARLHRTKAIQVKSDDSLAVLALFFQKDVRTIRRWCQAGHVPGAYQTKGGHWRVRITPQTVTTILSGLGVSTRKPKSVLRSRRWKRLLKTFKITCLKLPSLLLKLDRESQTMQTGSAEPLDSKRVSEETFSRYLATIRKSGGKKDRAVEFYDLMLAARELSETGRNVNAASLSKLLGIGRRTLFRHFPKQIRQVISMAHESLGKVPDKKPDDETDQDLISKETSETKHDKYEKILSPYIKYRKN